MPIGVLGAVSCSLLPFPLVDVGINISQRIVATAIDHKTLQANEQARNRSSQGRIALKKRDDTEYRESLSKKRKLQEAARIQREGKSSKKRKSGAQRNYNTKDKYDGWFKELMKGLLRIWIRECGDDYVFYDFWATLFDKLLLKEEANLSITVPRTSDGTGLPMRIAREYIEIAEIYLVPPTTKKCKDWFIRDEYKVVDTIKMTKLTARSKMVPKKQKGVRLDRIKKNEPFMDHCLKLLYAQQMN